MYEKIKNQRSHLRIGERIYDQYMQHCKDCQKTLIEVSQEHNDTVHALSKVEQHKYKVVQLQKEILRTRTRTRALQDELEVRMNSPVLMIKVMFLPFFLLQSDDRFAS